MVTKVVVEHIEKRGRKPLVIVNPFVIKDVNQLLFTEDCVDIRIDDLLTGIIRSYNLEHSNKTQNYVDYNKLLNIYRELDTISRPAVQELLMCSERQAKRYMQVIKTANVFVQRHYTRAYTTINDYVDVTKQQLRDGYWELL